MEKEIPRGKYPWDISRIKVPPPSKISPPLYDINMEKSIFFAALSIRSFSQISERLTSDRISANQQQELYL